MCSPRRILIQVEGKSIQIDWVHQAVLGEEVELVERGKGGTFMAKISAEGGRWLGTLLCQISLGTTLIGSTFRTTEPNGTLTGIVEANDRGDFLRIVVFNRAAGKFRTICFPAGSRGEAWSQVGSQLRRLLHKEELPKEVYKPPPIFNYPLQKDNQFRPSFAEMLGGRGVCTNNDLEGKTVTAPSKMSLNANWWSPVVICKAEHLNPDWAWVEMKVRRVFRNSKLRFPSSSEAIIELESEKEVDCILQLPPLTNWEGSFAFSRWTPMAGSLSKEDLCDLGKELKVKLIGIPFHLRVKSIVESLAKACSKWWEVEDETVNLNGDDACIILRNVDLNKLPRMLYLKEGGTSFPVIIRIAPMVAEVAGLSSGSGGQVPVGGNHQSKEESCVGIVEVQHGNSDESLVCPPGFDSGPRLVDQIQIINPMDSGGPSVLNVVCPNRFEALQAFPGHDSQEVTHQAQSGETPVFAENEVQLIQPVQQAFPGHDSQEVTHKAQSGETPVYAENEAQLIQPVQQVSFES
ncbi:hypothetical protein FRX31_015511 [Thalictrum thalictroides]|uniref:DUF4283 domain-containing protein n=1 Tax=Thalictrum thalictroides TaxID=46969 RepID=A0A7J6WD49_THATH|nr:hypothetical protein FRX31_015511 [Thalictrum thalictroides]